MYNFRKLLVYEKELKLNKDVKIKTNIFPKKESFSLTSQLQRTVDLIIINITKGTSNCSNMEFAKFLENAICSAHEYVACIDIALENKYLTKQQHKCLFEQIYDIIAMLTSFRRNLINYYKKAAFCELFSEN